MLDWGSCNILAIGLGNSVYLWDASNESVTKLLEVGDESGPVASVRWAPDGSHLAIGLDNSEVQLWNTVAIRLVFVIFNTSIICTFFEYCFTLGIAMFTLIRIN